MFYCLILCFPSSVRALSLSDGLKECHPRCVYQNYNRLIINCKYNNLPTTCFGLIRPSSGWNTASEENYLSDLKAGVQGRGRDLAYKYGVSGWNSVGTSVCPLGEFICWSVGPRSWFLRHGGPVSEIVGLKWSLYVCCCGGSTPWVWYAPFNFKPAWSDSSRIPDESGILKEQNTQEATVLFQLRQLNASGDSTVYLITKLHT